MTQTDSTTETFSEQLSRVQQMVRDNGEKWDLSTNDLAALSAVLASHRALMIAAKDAYLALPNAKHNEAINAALVAAIVGGGGRV